MIAFRLLVQQAAWRKRVALSPSFCSSRSLLFLRWAALKLSGLGWLGWCCGRCSGWCSGSVGVVVVAAVVGVAVGDVVVVAVVGRGAGAGAVVVAAVVAAGAGAVVVAAIVAADVGAWVVDHQMVSPPRHPENAVLTEQAQLAPAASASLVGLLTRCLLRRLWS